MTGPSPKQNRRMRGFERASGLLSKRIQKVGESRGFAVSRLLTHWAEIVGEQTAAIARPVNISYARGGFGATLTVLTTGAQAPMLEMQKDRLRERVNACYGYSAIARIRITQTAPTGFAEGQVAFGHAGKQSRPQDPALRRAAKAVAAPVADDTLRQALETLGENVFSRNRNT